MLDVAKIAIYFHFLQQVALTNAVEWLNGINTKISLYAILKKFYQLFSRQ